MRWSSRQHGGHFDRHFTELNIQCMTLAGGALREGLVYGMLHLSVDQDIRTRTLRNVQRRFIVDTDQAQRVGQLASLFADQVKTAGISTR